MLQEIGTRITGDDQECVIGKRPGVRGMHHLDQSPIDTAGQFFGKTAVLMKSFPLKLAVSVPDQNAGRDDQGQEKDRQQAPQALLVVSLDECFG